MIFNNDKAIYIQIADRLCDEIIAGTYGEDSRIPSVREYAMLLQVNTNTAVKAYDELARKGIIYNKRGIGYFVSSGARAHIADTCRTDFMERTLPTIFHDMRLLGIGIDEVTKAWKESRES